MPEAVQVLLSALVGAAAGAFATAYKSRKELESLYDIELRRRRIDTYSELWKLLEPLAYWSPARPLTYGGIGQLSRALRSWYFGSGGLFLSHKTRAPYFNLQESLTRLSEGRPTDDSTVLDDDSHEVVKALGSRLRTATTEDVATRVEPSLAGPFGARLMRARRSPLHIQVDRRWDFELRPPVPAFFVVLGNRSDNHLEIENVTLDGIQAEIGRFLLQPREERELKAPIDQDGPRPGEIPTVTVTLAGGRQVSSSETPDVPLRTPVLERFAP
jgi:hypothetical protein